jgi:hypothetical protein
MENRIINTPLEVEILLWYYYSQEDYPNIDNCMTEINRFLEAGILQRNTTSSNSRFCGNLDALKVYVNAVCSIPLPKMKWHIEPELLKYRIDQKRKEIHEIQKDLLK